MHPSPRLTTPPARERERGETKERMGVLSAAPKSFKVDRKSYFASKLKSLIFDRLRHFCPDYADDVLAEYVTVLVCNGKNQHQARDDLEAFLGKMSAEFVSWLWHVLLKYEPSSCACISSDGKDKTSSNPCDTYKENDYKARKSKGQPTEGNSESDNLMGKDGEEIYSLSAKVRKSHGTLTSVVRHFSPLKETMPRIIQSSGLRSKSADVDSLVKVVSSLEVHRTRSVDNSEEPFSSASRRPGSSPQSGPLAQIRYSVGSKLSERPQMRCFKAALEKSVSPLTLVSPSHDNKPRRSVWDRLGKPLEDEPSRGQTAKFYATDETHINKDKIGHRLPVTHKHGEQIVQLSPSCPTRTDGHSYTVGHVHHAVEDARADKINYSKGSENVVETISEVPSVSNITRKRHFGDLSSQTDDDVAAEVVLQAHKRPEVSLEASQVVVSQVHDVKLRLRQLEIEMAKLRSKQCVMEKDGKAKLLVNHGVMKATEEDTDSRTILVTNVHFKATKEAISMYFGKCGAVVDVVLSTDNKPFAPQRSAFITFGSNESADKALAFNGTTFYSRTIMVSRKGETAGVSSAQIAAKRIQVQASHPKCSVTLDRSSFPSSHLQWRRESVTSTHSEPRASNCEQMQGPAGSASQQELLATSLSMQYGDSKKCPLTLADKSNEAEA